MLSICLAALDRPELREQFRAFFLAHASLALRAARRHLDAHLAQDAVQEAFTAVARNFSRVAALPPRAQRAYLLAAVRTSAIDLLRREGRYTGLDDGEALPGGPDPTEAAEAAEGYQRLVGLILAMPETYREVLRRRLVLEESPEETAAAMGLPVETIYRRFSQGRKLLQERLLEEGIHP